MSGPEYDMWLYLNKQTRYEVGPNCRAQNDKGNNNCNAQLFRTSNVNSNVNLPSVGITLKMEKLLSINLN